MNAKLVKIWMLENDKSPEQLAVMLKISFYTVRKILRGEKVNDSLLELLSVKTGIPTSALLNPDIGLTHDVKNVKRG